MYARFISLIDCLKMSFAYIYIYIDKFALVLSCINYVTSLSSPDLLLCCASIAHIAFFGITTVPSANMVMEMECRKQLSCSRMELI